jgi:hypothetical protein
MLPALPTVYRDRQDQVPGFKLHYYLLTLFEKIGLIIATDCYKSVISCRIASGTFWNVLSSEAIETTNQ